jgi:predicted SprT family Zn-dependent metalloprotease
MVTARRKSARIAPAPPPRQDNSILHCDDTVRQWLDYYWQKLRLPLHERSSLALTQDRQEYMKWTGKRLNFMVLGCYCYLPPPPLPVRPTRPAKPNRSTQTTNAVKSPRSLAHTNAISAVTGPEQPLPGFEELHSAPAQPLPLGHRHLIFIEPDMQPQSIQVTVAHELIHLADRVNGTPRRHRHHGYDSIAADEAAITGYGLEDLRRLLHEESARREHLRRQRRPIRYLYQCPNCGREYPRARRYSQAVSCSHCDKTYNPRFQLRLKT